mgnify:FL=1
MKPKYVYFDHNSTTPIDPRVLEEMFRFFGTEYGNASSRHTLGTHALRAVETARGQVAELVGVESKQVVFTSGGTESNNLVIKGISSGSSPGKILISGIEHPCIVKPAENLKYQGWMVEKIPVSNSGVVKTKTLKRIIDSECKIISVMLANNETGVCQPVSEVVDIAKEYDAFVHTDAVQALGKIPVSFKELGVQALSISAHKLNGPKGVGALILDKRLSINPLIEGGGHEDGLRSGTLNVPAIVGFGKACEIAHQNPTKIKKNVAPLIQALDKKLKRMGATIFGCNETRIPNTSYFSLPGVAGETLVIELDKAGFAVSSGAACSGNKAGPSEVLEAMQVNTDIAAGAVRVSLGISNTLEEVMGFCDGLEQIFNRLRTMSAIA